MGDSKRRKDRSRGKAGDQPADPGAKRVFAVEMSGFVGYIHALGRLPLDYNRALPLIEQGKIAEGADMLKSALIKVELAKAVLMGNLAFTAMKEGDIDSVKGYLDIGYQSLSELGLEESELGKMFALVLAQLPSDKAEGETEGDGAAGAGQDDKETE